MSSQLTLNLDGTMVSITPQEGQRTILEIVTNNGVSSLKSLHTEDIEVETKEPMKVRELPPINKNINNDSDDIDQLDPIEELKMYDDEKPYIKPLNLDHLDDEGEDIVEKMSSDLDQPSAMNYGRHMELLENDDELNFKPGPIVELENDKPYEKVELVDENDVHLDEYNDDGTSFISRILEHEKNLAEKNENVDSTNDNNIEEDSSSENLSEDSSDEDEIENSSIDSDGEIELQSSQSNDDSAFLERDRNKEKTTSLSFEPDEDYGEDETEF